MNSITNDDLPTGNKLVYRMFDGGPPLLKEILDKRGWIPYVEGSSTYWNLSWKGNRYPLSEYENLQPFQRLNHFPNTAIITRKDTLFRLLKKLRMIYRNIYDFFPLTISLPTDYLKFVRIYSTEEFENNRSLWICKPVDLSRGRGIFIFRELSDLTYDCSCVIQRYIPNPFLISGYKFDLRCYVLVRSYNPLVVYFYEEGLTRFATIPYDTHDKSLKNLFSHLTNTSINKYSPTIDVCKNEIGSGCRWKINRLRSYFKQKGISFDKIWNRIKAIAILTLLPVAHEVDLKPHSTGCFELYGFDILIDENLKPWLLEVNLSPALNVDSQTDIDVKLPLLEDILGLMNIKNEFASDAKAYYDEIQKIKTSKIKIKTKRSLQAELDSKKSRKETLDFPNQTGNWTKIYPFDDSNLKSQSPVKIGSPEMKNIVNNIKKHFF